MGKEGVTMSRKLHIISLLAAFVLLVVHPNIVYGQCNKSASQCISEANGAKTKTPATSNATKSKSTSQQSAMNTSSTFMSFLKLIFALFFILLLIYGLYRLVHKKTQSFQDYGTLRNLGGVSVGPNRSVQLIRVGQELLVVGVGEDVKLLKEINDAEVIRDLLNQENNKPSQMGSIWAQLKDWYRDWSKRSKKTSSTFSTILNDRLKKIQDDRKKTFQTTNEEKEQD